MDHPDDNWDHFDEGGEDGEYCETCANSGIIDCHCGGDLCICENYGEIPCPDCSNV